MSILARGAEATVSAQKNTVSKIRTQKSYRHPVLDAALRQSRSRREKKILEKAAKYIRVPKVFEGNDDTLVMERIHGKTLKEVLEKNTHFAKPVGEMLAALHNNNIIHGDLTTSNILVEKKTNELVFIDFGLGNTSLKAEDKAVDLHLFHQTLESKHQACAQHAWNLFLKSYTSKIADNEILHRLVRVESRGRHKNKH